MSKKRTKSARNKARAAAKLKNKPPPRKPHKNQPNYWVELDRLWFEDNPEESYYVRDPVRGELDFFKVAQVTPEGRRVLQLGAETLKRLEVLSNGVDVTIMKIVVLQVEKGWRMRWPAAQLGDGPIVSYDPHGNEMGLYEILTFMREQNKNMTREDAEALRGNAGMDHCQKCHKEFDHGEITHLVTVPGAAHRIDICEQCLSEAPPGVMLTGMSLYFRKDEPPDDPRVLKSVKRLKRELKKRGIEPSTMGGN
jgi:hypothetical protein